MAYKNSANVIGDALADTHVAWLNRNQWRIGVKCWHFSCLYCVHACREREKEDRRSVIVAEYFRVVDTKRYACMQCKRRFNGSGRGSNAGVEQHTLLWPWWQKAPNERANDPKNKERKNNNNNKNSRADTHRKSESEWKKWQIAFHWALAKSQKMFVSLYIFPFLIFSLRSFFCPPSNLFGVHCTQVVCDGSMVASNFCVYFSIFIFLFFVQLFFARAPTEQFVHIVIEAKQSSRIRQAIQMVHKPNVQRSSYIWAFFLLLSRCVSASLCSVLPMKLHSHELQTEKLKWQK